MRFDPGKAFPHPVLRPESTDYPRAEFQADIRLSREQHSTHLQMEANFDLGDPDLERLISDGSAEYLIVLRCSSTHTRIADRTHEKRIVREIPAGTLSGKVELAPYIVAIRELRAFRAGGWHDDWSEAGAFDLVAGTVLALDEPKEYYVDNAEESEISSFLIVRSADSIADGEWKCSWESKRVEILMSPRDHERFNALRSGPADIATAASIWNGVYLPALMQTLVAADSNHELDIHAWYRSLDHQLEAKRLSLLGDGGDRLSDAQALLNFPFGRIAQAAEEATQ